MTAFMVATIAGIAAAKSANEAIGTTACGGVVSRAQAAEGLAVYASKCSSCHLDSLAGGMNESPPLKGERFLSE